MKDTYSQLYHLVSDEREAAMAFTRLAEGEDVRANSLIDNLGYLEAYRLVLDCAYGKRELAAGYEKALPRWATRLDAQSFVKDREDIARLAGGFTFPSDSVWPQELDSLGSSRPLGLWYLGELDVTKEPCVSIVGSRDCTDYGRTLARDFAYELASVGIAVVSGGAFGIDSAAHEGVLAVGRTIVVFANGLGRFYPTKNRPLFEAIADSGGLFLSESPPDARPHRHRFLSRNRIIAALGLVTLVVEAPYRSGAISTAHHGLEIGRDVCAVPGSVHSPHSSGCHRLLREGAVCVTSSDEILELLPSSVRARLRTPESLMMQLRSHTISAVIDAAVSSSVADSAEPAPHNPLAQRVYEGLQRNKALTVGEIAREVGLTPRETLSGLAALESYGGARNIAGKWLLTIDN